MHQDLTIINDPFAVRVVESAGELIIRNTTGRKEAGDIWDAIRGFRKQAEEQKEEVCRPFKSAWEETKKPFDDFMKECKEKEALLQRLMSDWDREQLRMQREEQALLQELADKENQRRRLDAEMMPEVPPAPLVVVPIVPVKPKTVETIAGTKQTSTVKKIYAVKDAQGAERIHAGLKFCAGLLKDFPNLFVLDQVAFNQLAKTGLLDGRDDVTITETIIYTQRK